VIACGCYHANIAHALMSRGPATAGSGMNNDTHSNILDASMHAAESMALGTAACSAIHTLLQHSGGLSALVPLPILGESIIQSQWFYLAPSDSKCDVLLLHSRPCGLIGPAHAFCIFCTLLQIARNSEFGVLRCLLAACIAPCSMHGPPCAHMSTCVEHAVRCQTQRTVSPEPAKTLRGRSI
jgi:hypothetical protein